jgi:sulfur relay (sulfurtransferase) DsrC/TusE family protein
MKAEYLGSTERSRPKDRSLESFKDWVAEIAKRLTTQKSMIQLTEEEWKKNWKEFWQQQSRR